MRARSLAKTDTDDALHKLDKILELLHLAAAVEAAPPDQMPPRPELTKEGGKPRLQKAALQPVSMYVVDIALAHHLMEGI